MSRRPASLSRRLGDGAGIPFMGSLNPKSRPSPFLSIGLALVGAFLIIGYVYSGSGRSNGDKVGEAEMIFSSSSTATRGAVGKLPKPRAKDPNKREMNLEEKHKLGFGLQSMPPEKMPQLLQIIRKRNDRLAQEGDEIELDIEALDTETLWELDRFVTNWKKAESKAKRQALLVNSSSALAPAPSISADIDDIDIQIPASEKVDGMKKSKKEGREEDVDIGDEMPEISFPHVEIEKDEGVVQGQPTGQGNENAGSSSSSSSSSSSGDSSSSSDSDSGSSSGNDSDADDAQS